MQVLLCRYLDDSCVVCVWNNSFGVGSVMAVLHIMFVNDLECVFADCWRLRKKRCFSLFQFRCILWTSVGVLILEAVLDLRVIIAACQCEHVAHVLDLDCTGYAVNSLLFCWILVTPCACHMCTHAT